MFYLLGICEKGFQYKGNQKWKGRKKAETRIRN